MGEIEDDTEALAFRDQLASEVRQTMSRRAARRENSACGGGVLARMGKQERAQTELVKDAQEMETNNIVHATKENLPVYSLNQTR